MRDDVLLADILDSPWEKLRRAARAQLGPGWSTDELAIEVSWCATACAALASRAVASASGVPDYAEYEVSAALANIMERA